MHTSLEKIFISGKKIAFVGGGTGGHIEPIISIYREFINIKNRSIWIGGANSNEEKKAEQLGVNFHSIHILKLSTTKSVKVLLYPFILIQGIFEASKILKENTIEMVFSKGGPGSVAVGIAAWIMNIPLYIHESDTIPGRSNKILALFAQKVFLGFESSKKYFKKNDCETIGQILDPIFVGEKDSSQNSPWKTKKKHIFVICGSQGSRSIFEEIIQSCKDLDAEWIVSLGNLNTNMREKFHVFPDIQLFDWIEKDKIVQILRHADLCITRGSATTLAEIDVFHIRKIIVPLPDAAENHQFHNALEYEKRGDILLEQKNLSKLKEIIHINV